MKIGRLGLIRVRGENRNGPGELSRAVSVPD